MILAAWGAHPQKNKMNMKPTAIIVLCFLVLTGKLSVAQYTHFTTTGTIEYNKTVNMYAIIQKSINKDNEQWYGPAFEAYKKNQPQFKVLKSTLTFSKDKTLFTPAEPDASPSGFFGNNPIVVQNNTIYTDLATNLFTNRKAVFEETFLVKDTTRKINWKITSETRDIAGFTCRRANAIVMDSIYVVAFYTDRIPVSGGPENFTGLPGMILGVALPHENITWFATKVTDAPLEPKALTPPSKGKPVNNKQFMATLQSALKDWGDYAKSYLKAFSLL
jgi:GLPGLI family protein